MASDWKLLQRYVRQNSEAAFAVLVRLHLNLVYSVALRQLRSMQLAEEVAQSVFTDLARNAAKLKPDTILSAWLYQVARRTAIDVTRRESRRQARERIAVEMAKMNSISSEWTQIEPLLDEAMESLGETDRTAVLLRFFENKSLREVGKAFGTTDDAAQKRVSRAVERLREFFTRRGVTIGAAGFASAISVNAIQSAPVSLAAAISAAAALAGTTAVTTATATATKAIAMTSLQKTIVGVTLAIVAGAGIHEARQASNLRAQNQTLRQQQASLAGQIRHLRQERDDEAKRFALLSAKPAPRLPAPPVQLAMKTNAPPTEDLQFTNLWSRFTNAEPRLSAAQVAAFLKANRTNAASLLAAYRTSGDKSLLKEAMAKFPNNPQVALEAAMSIAHGSIELTPEELQQQRQWLDAFEKSAPDNALANYLSAFNYFNSGQIEQGIQELTSAAGKSVSDYTVERAQDDEEAYLSAGYSAAEAARISDSWLTLSQLAQIKHLGVDLVELANAYNQAGDQTSAQAAYQMAMNLGKNYESPSTDWTLISQLVGIAIQKTALSAMNPNSPYGNNGQTVQDQLNQITQKRAAISRVANQAMSLLPNLSDQDILNYENRRRAFGELAAMQWVVNKFGHQ